MNSQINRDAEFCGKVPLHQTNLIQPHGVLLVVKQEDLAILQASENAELLLGMSVSQIVTSKLGDHLSASSSGELISYLGTVTGSKTPFLLELKSGIHLATIHQQQDLYIIELEITNRTSVNSLSLLSVHQQIVFIMEAMESATTTVEACEIVARELKKFAGFDKVMVYQFDEFWNGDVIAEAKEDDMDSYLGLKFPASDIPKQARELYKRTPFRLIPTTDYEPVKIYPVLNPYTNSFTNLSDSSLRSVAGVHLEYLRNMKVVASMSTRILKEGVLWGLIACHHREPKYLSYEMCAVFELISNIVGAKIRHAQVQDELIFQASKQKQLAGFIHAVYGRGGIHAYKRLLAELFEADGIAVISNQQVFSEGLVPANHEIEDLALWLSSFGSSEIYHQAALSVVFEPALAYAEKVSGLLAIPLDVEKSEYVLAFRSEAVRHVSWGGNPSEAVQFESDGKKYHPRASFEQWKETVLHTSLPWKKELLHLATEVQHFLMVQMHKD